MRTPADAPDPFNLPAAPAAKPAPAPAPSPETLFETGDWAPPGIRIKPDTAPPASSGDAPPASLAAGACGCGHRCRYTDAQLAMLDALEC